MNTSTVTVKGMVDSKELIAFISKKAGKHAEVVVPKKEKGQNQNQNDGEHKDNEKEENKDKDGKNIGLSYPNVPPGLVYAPQYSAMKTRMPAPLCRYHTMRKQTFGLTVLVGYGFSGRYTLSVTRIRMNSLVFKGVHTVISIYMSATGNDFVIIHICCDRLGHRFNLVYFVEIAMLLKSL
ncbi:hypothetical protein Tco_0827511 [Tanacetum coccineum]